MARTQNAFGYGVSNLLVVDWDFFTVMEEVGDNWPLYDWGHSESNLYEFYSNLAWPGRAAGFKGRNMSLPPLSGEEVNFWDRFNINDAVLFYADSNVRAFDEAVSPEVSEIWLYDAHHDCGYQGDKTMNLIESKGLVDCESWMIGYYLLNNVLPSRMHVRYPTWKTYAFDVEPEPALKIDRQFDSQFNGTTEEINAVFVCRSSAWTPPWHDAAFTRFIQSAPVTESVCLDDNFQPRNWDMAEVDEYVAVMEGMMVRQKESTLNEQGRLQGN